ncbi:hypothetical protein Hanom_Chr01g00047531 [Helianthus anomalus]
MNSLYFVMLRWLLLSSLTVGSFMSSAAPPNSQVGMSLLGSHWLNLKVPEPARPLQNLPVHLRADKRLKVFDDITFFGNLLQSHMNRKTNCPLCEFKVQTRPRAIIGGQTVVSNHYPLCSNMYSGFTPNFEVIILCL